MLADAPGGIPAVILLATSSEVTLCLGSGRAPQAFMRALGERVRRNTIRVQGVATSQETAELARQVGVPLVSLDEAGELAITVDGADEVDPSLNLINGYGRALVREKIVAASSKQLAILVGQEKLVPQLGSRGKLPVEVVPFLLPLCERRLRQLGCNPVPFRKDGKLFVSDNGNHIIDCEIAPIAAPAQVEQDILAIPVWGRHGPVSGHGGPGVGGGQHRLPAQRSATKQQT